MFSRIQDEKDRKDGYTILNDVLYIVGQTSSMHPDDFIERWLDHDLTIGEQAMLHDFYRVCLWYQHRAEDAARDD